MNPDGATDVDDKPMESNYQAKIEQGKRVETKGQSQIDDKLKGLTFSIAMEPLSDAERHHRIQTLFEVVPNATRDDKPLPLLGISAKFQKSSVTYGPLREGCGTMVRAMLSPLDPLTGSPVGGTRPHWWDRMLADPATNVQWVSNFVVQGHLLNQRVGGPGTNMSNLVPFAKSTNGQHHAGIERRLQAAAKIKNLSYVVHANYSQPPNIEWFDGHIPAEYLKYFPRTITCTIRVYGSKPSYNEYDPFTTTVTNATKGQE